jgi:uncharacterized membrane protein
MQDLSFWLSENWFGILLLAGALGLTIRAAIRSPHRFALFCWAGFLSSFAVGALFLPWEWALWSLAGLGAVWFAMLLFLLLTGGWSARSGFVLGGAFLLALGGVASGAVEAGAAESVRVLRSLEPTKPWWLLLLLLPPVIVYFSYRSLAGLGPVRRWIAIGLRCSLIILLALALSEVRLRHQNENITVFYVIDRSLSIPEEFDPGSNLDSTRIDRRWERIERFVNDTVKYRGALHKNDRSGLILFGRRPRLEFPASTSPLFNFKLKDSTAVIDGSYTDIAAALKLTLASFPEGTGKRVVLFSDGNENLGNAEEQARVAKQNGVQIDIVPLATGYRNENEVLVERVEAPPRTEQGSRLPIRVLVRSYNPRTVYGTLTLKQITEGETTMVLPSPVRVQLKPGLTPFSFKQPLANEQRSYTYQAIFQPEAVQGDKGELIPGLPGDRVQNNSATTHVVALGQRRILIIESRKDEHQLLVDRLKSVGNSKYRVHSITVDDLPQNKAELGVFLSNYDCVILANVAASDIEAGVVGEGRQTGVITEEQQEIIRSNTHDQGCGLIMIGGPNSFGAGGWNNSPVEKALPVDCEIKSFKVQGKSGLAMIMHASEMADGNRWQKEIAKLAVRKLTEYDEVGILHYDWGKHKWHIPLTVIGGKKNTLVGLIDRMTPGDMPDFDPALKLAFDSLIEPARQLTTKHVIIISDGDPGMNNPTLLRDMKAAKVTVTTVGVATHGSSQDAALMSIAEKTGGRFYKVLNARALPSIYIKETRIISQSVLYEQRFQPQLLFRSGPTDKLPETLKPLFGYVRTTPKESPLVEMPIMAPKVGDQEFPILAYWSYGLGRSVAFTSDARSQPSRPAWDREWASSDMYAKFWEQVVDYVLRPTETGKLQMTTEYNDGKVRVIVDARDANNRPITDLNFQGSVTSPTPRADQAKKFALKFEQKNSGLYEAEFKADEAGSYFINAQSSRDVKTMKDGKEVVTKEVDSIRNGVTIPYSPEFADLESNLALMERIRDNTGGRTYTEEEIAELAGPSGDAKKVALAEQVFRSGLPQFKNLQPIWYWLVFAAAIGLFFDVAVRRIAVQPADASAMAVVMWNRLRGRAAQASATPQFMDRLKSRKQQVGESLEQLRSARRFEGEETAKAAPTMLGEGESAAAVPPPRKAPTPTLSPGAADQPVDYASRLLKAKKKVWEERQQDKEQQD